MITQEVYCEVGATERGCSGSIGSDDTRGYGAGSGDVGKELPRGISGGGTWRSPFNSTRFRN